MSTYFKAAERCGMRRVVPYTPDMCLSLAKSTECDRTEQGAAAEVEQGRSPSPHLRHPHAAGSLSSSGIDDQLPSVVLMPASQLPLREKREAHTAGLSVRRQKLLEAEAKDLDEFQQRQKAKLVHDEELAKQLREEECQRLEEEARQQAVIMAEVERVHLAKERLRERVGDNFLAVLDDRPRDNSRRGVESRLLTFVDRGGRIEDTQLTVIV